MPNENGLPPSLEELMDGAGVNDNLDTSKKQVNLGDHDEKSPEELKAEKDVLLAKEKEEKEGKEKDLKVKEEAERLEKEKKEKENLSKTSGKEDPSSKKKEDPNEEEDEVVTEAKSFWEDVRKITGEDLDIELNDTTPEVAAKFAQAFRDKGIESFENDLKAKFPREYRALEMAAEGIDPSSLYKDQAPVDYSKMVVDEKDLNTAKVAYTEALRLKGNSDEDIADLIKVAEDKGKLLEKGKQSLTELQGYQASRDKELNDESDRQIREKSQRVDQFVLFVDTLVSKGEVGDFIIPEKDRKPLVDQLVKNTRYIDGKFFLMEEITEKDINKKLQAEYFKYKDGNLNDLIKRKAATEGVKRLKARVAESDKKPTGTSSGKTGNITLAEMTED